MYSYTLLLALLPAVLGAPAPQAAAATPIDSTAASSSSSSLSSSLSSSMSSACVAKRSASSTISKSASSSKSSSKSTSKSTSSTKSTSTSKSTSKSSTSSRASSSSSSRPISSSSIRPSSSATQSSSSPSQSTTWWKPTLTNTFLYDADRINVEAPTVTTNTGVKLTKDVYIIDMEGHTKAQIKAYKDKGKKVVCYISAGSWEPFRDDKLKFDPACYCGAGQGYDKSTGLCSTDKNKLGEWDEWWLDIKTPKCITNVQSVMAARIQAAHDKGCDGVDPDNVDAYANEVSYGVPFGITDTDQVNYLKWWATTAHNLGMAIGLKNAGNLLADYDKTPGRYQKDLVANFDFNVIESCTQYTECHIYNSMLDAGKPQIRVEYESRTKKCPAKVKGVTFSVYSGDVLNTKDVNLDCV